MIEKESRIKSIETPWFDENSIPKIFENPILKTKIFKKGLINREKKLKSHSGLIQLKNHQSFILTIKNFTTKKLKKGLFQLSEEGAIQIFCPITNNSLILGAIGILQFDVVIERLKVEYQIDAMYETVNIALARWIRSKKEKSISDFLNKNKSVQVIRL